jgi:hypothetical protein
MLTIYSLGDVDFMIRMAESAELAFSDGGIGNSRLPGVAMGFSLLIAMFKQIFDNKQFHIKTVFLSMMLFMIMFMPKVPVVIESARTGQISAPIVLPVGIAAGAWISTGIGHGFANGLNESYQAVNGGLAQSSIGISTEPLNALLKSRFSGMDASYLMSETPLNLQRYMDECVNRDIVNSKSELGQNKGSIKEDDLLNKPFSWDLLKVESNGSWFVDLSQNGIATTMTCENAWSSLSADVDGNSKLSQDLEAQAYMISGASNKEVSDGLAILRHSNTAAIDFYSQNFLKALYVKASANSGWLNQSDVMTFNAQYTAMESRRVSQAAQSSFFLETAPALMTWFESFIFLLAPLMPFLISLGEKGMGMFTKWMLILVSVNVWPIIQVGINAYNQFYIDKLLCGNVGMDGEIGASNCLSNPEMQKWSLETWGGMDASYTQLETFVSTAAMLQTMVPSFAMMIIYGSVHTMISAVGQMQSGAKPDTSTLTPPAIKMSGNTLTDLSGRSSSRTQDGWRSENTYGQATSNDGATYSGSSASSTAVQASQKDLASVTQTHSQAVAQNSRDMEAIGDALQSSQDYKTAGNFNLNKSATAAFMATKGVAEETNSTMGEARNKTIADASNMNESEGTNFIYGAAASLGINTGSVGKDKDGNFKPSSMIGKTQFGEVASQVLGALGVDFKAGGKASWDEVQSSLKAHTQSTGNQYTAQESDGYAEKFVASSQKIDGSKLDAAMGESSSKGDSTTETLGANWQTSSDQVASTSEQVAQAKSRVQELGETQARTSTTQANSSVKVWDMLSSDQKAEQYHDTNKVMSLAGSAMDKMMTDRFGGDWANLKGDDLQGALSNLSKGNGPKEMTEFANSAKGLLGLATDKDIATGVVNSAVNSVNGKRIGNEKDGAAAVFEATRTQASIGQGVNAEAAGLVFSGTMLKDMAVNGNQKPGGHKNGMAVGEAFEQNGLGLVNDHKPMTLNKDEQAIANKANNRMTAHNQDITDGQVDTAKRAGDVKKDAQKIQDKVEKQYNEVASPLTNSKTGVEAKIAPAEKRHEEQKAHLENLTSTLATTGQMQQGLSKELIDKSGGNAPLSVNDFMALSATKMVNNGADEQGVQKALSTLQNRDVAPQELNRAMNDEMKNPGKTGAFDFFGTTQEQRNGALSMASLAAGGVNYINDVEKSLQKQGKELPQDMKQDRDRLTEVSGNFLSAKPFDEQMRVSQLVHDESVKQNNPEAGAKIANNLTSDGQYSTFGVKENKDYRGDGVADATQAQRSERFNQAVPQAFEYAQQQAIIQGLEGRGDLSQKDKNLVGNLKSSFNEATAKNENDLPAAAFVGQSRKEGDSNFIALAGAASNSGLRAEFGNDVNLMKGLQTLSHGDEIPQARGNLNSISHDFAGRGEEVANYLRDKPELTGALLSSIKDDGLRASVTDGLASYGVGPSAANTATSSVDTATQSSSVAHAEQGTKEPEIKSTEVAAPAPVSNGSESYGVGPSAANNATSSVDTATQSSSVTHAEQGAREPEIKIVEVEAPASASNGSSSNELYNSSALSTNFDVAQAEGWKMNVFADNNQHVNSSSLNLPAELSLDGPSTSTLPSNVDGSMDVPYSAQAPTMKA